MDEHLRVLCNDVLAAVSRQEQHLGDVRVVVERLQRLEDERLEIAQSIIDHMPRGRGRPTKHVVWAREILGLA